MERPESLGAPRGGSAGDGETVAQRKAAMLPALLTAVRWRRRRRVAGRAALVAVVAVVAGLGLDAARQRWAGPAHEPQTVPVVLVPPRVRCEVVRDVPDIVARCASVPAAPAEWWIDDAELQRLLDDDARPSGLVCVAGRVAVTAAAIDPLAALE